MLKIGMQVNLRIYERKSGIPSGQKAIVALSTIYTNDATQSQEQTLEIFAET